MKNIISFGTREFEIPYFKEIGDKYNYNFKLESTFNTEDIITLSKGFKVIMVRGNCNLNSNAMKELYNNGVEIILSRSVGYNHLDVNTCDEIGLKIFRVVSYSPNAIAELALTLAMSLLRNVSYTLNKTSQKDFTIDNQMFSREIRNCTVGVIGCGKIGYTTANLFKGLGAKVIGFDRSKRNEMDYVELDYLIRNSDVISIHVPAHKENYHLVNKEFISKMKKDAILINTSRGELVNIEELVVSLENNGLYGAALDVLENENNFFFKKHDELIGIYKRINNLYPKLLITPHVGASTDEALRNMIEISINNLEEYLSTGKCSNSLTK